MDETESAIKAARQCCHGFCTEGRDCPARESQDKPLTTPEECEALVTAIVLVAIAICLGAIVVPLLYSLKG
jgi:hypothetical protein